MVAFLIERTGCRDPNRSERGREVVQPEVPVRSTYPSGSRRQVESANDLGREAGLAEGDATRLPVDVESE